jgi:hypothetical protein
VGVVRGIDMTKESPCGGSFAVWGVAIGESLRRGSSARLGTVLRKNAAVRSAVLWGARESDEKKVRGECPTQLIRAAP